MQIDVGRDTTVRFLYLWLALNVLSLGIFVGLMHTAAAVMDVSNN